MAKESVSNISDLECSTLSSGGDFLKSLGAAELLDRETLQGEPKPLGREIYAGCVDSAGGKVLANILPLIKHSGAVACCGLAAGMPLNTTVAPFILRGVTLAGVDSVFMPVERRLAAYNKFGPILGSGKLELLAGEDKTVGLAGVLDLADKMLKVRLSGKLLNFKSSNKIVSTVSSIFMHFSYFRVTFLGDMW